jgi:hypothetical protein
VPVAQVLMTKVLTAKVAITKVPITKVQSQAVVAAAVRAHLDQAAQPALQPGQLAELVGDRGQLGLGRPDDLVGGPGLSGAEQVADLGQGEAEPPGPADEGQPPPVILGVLTESGPAPGGLRQQPAPLIEPDRLDPDPFGVSEFPDRQPSHSRQASSRTPVRSQALRRPRLT